MRINKIFKDFFESEKTGGFLLIFATFISILISNTSIGHSYVDFWETSLFNHSFTHWINDGLMTLFFLLIGLELKHEVFNGALTSFKKAAFPLVGALGGMIVPMIFFFIATFQSQYQDGIGIPMATDIAFAIGILSLLGNKIPVALKLFLTALAVVDDLGAIIVIALFYTKTISMIAIGIVLMIILTLYFLNKYKIHSSILFSIGGIGLWYFMLQSGIHATLSGVILAFLLPNGKMSNALQHHLHLPVAYLILPLFALANTSIVLHEGWSLQLISSYSIGILIGLLLGKPLGIFSFTYFASKLGWIYLPKDLNWNLILGVGFLGGIGFTMSIFITLLAYEDQNIIEGSKLAILIASILSGVAGFFYLRKQFAK